MTDKKQEIAFRCEHPAHDPPLPTWASVVGTSAYRVVETTTAKGGAQSQRVISPVCGVCVSHLPKNAVEDRWEGATEHTSEALTVG